MRKKIFCGILFFLAGCSITCAGTKEKEPSAICIGDGNGVICYLENGTDATKTYLHLKEQTEQSLCAFFNRTQEELQIRDFCILGKKAVTVEVKIEETFYTVTCTFQGEVLTIGCSGCLNAQSHRSRFSGY